MDRHQDAASAARAGIKVLALLLGSLWIGGAHAAEPALFVGCPAEGMSGPVPAPATPPASTRVPAAHAGQLALYAAEGQQVLAPRGWHCIETYGSEGAILLVTPRPYTATAFPDANSLAGPAVELSLLSGENSGRDQVAAVFSRLFPFKRDFIRSAADNYDIPARFPGTGPSAAAGPRSTTSHRRVATGWAPARAACSRAPTRSSGRPFWLMSKAWTAWCFWTSGCRRICVRWVLSSSVRPLRRS